MASLFRQNPPLKRLLRRSFTTTPHRAAEHVRIVEVGPRDGLQNEKNAISLETKLELIDRLAKTGVTHMEAGSFVPAKWVPQMASTNEIFQNLLNSPPSSPHPIAYNYLVPNMRGLENLLKLLQAFNSVSSFSNPDPQKDDTAPVTSTSNPNETSSREPSPSPISSPSDTGSAPTTSTQNPNDMSSTNPASSSSTSSPSFSPPPIPPPEISLFAAATESFSKANTNTTIADSLSICRALISAAKSTQSSPSSSSSSSSKTQTQTPPLRVRGYVSVSLGCPYEGPDVPPSRVASIASSLLEAGCDEVSLADTTGMGTAPRTRRLLSALSAAGIRAEDLALHFHDTYGQALVNTVVGLEHGVRVFDASVGGLGGCPYSKGATGNVSTEDLVHLCHSLGMETGVTLEEVARVGEWITGVVGRVNEGRAGKAVLARLRG